MSKKDLGFIFLGMGINSSITAVCSISDRESPLIAAGIFFTIAIILFWRSRSM